ncbi:unnamed protein product [Schistosoma mattheei]|uniref:Uncharacterized protein n=1 Tax=Schistosoma mattheei TaxID=31246 RepID=A0A183PXC7_9TREM|nr:unnamed protein product [Schistosoma mattheei]
MFVTVISQEADLLCGDVWSGRINNEEEGLSVFSVMLLGRESPVKFVTLSSKPDLEACLLGGLT